MDMRASLEGFSFVCFGLLVAILLVIEIWYYFEKKKEEIFMDELDSITKSMIIQALNELTSGEYAPSRKTAKAPRLEIVVDKGKSASLARYDSHQGSKMKGTL